MQFDPKKNYSFYQPPVDGNSILAVFENPTWKEQLLNRPVMGETGIHLSLLLDILRNMRCEFSEHFRNQLYKYHIGIVNAIRFSGDLSNVKQCVLEKLIEENGEILAHAVNNSKLVLLFGENAQNAYIWYRKHSGINLLKQHQCVISVYHLSNRALAQIGNASAISKFLKRKSLVGFIPLLPMESKLAVIAEYIAYTYERQNNCPFSFEDFQSFIKPFLNTNTNTNEMPEDFGTISVIGGYQ